MVISCVCIINTSCASYKNSFIKLTSLKINAFQTPYLSTWTVGQKKRNTPIHFNTSYRIELKLVLIIMDYYLLQFDSLKFFSGVRLHGGSLPNFNFFNVNPQIFQWDRKVHLSNCLKINFHNIPTISLSDIRCRNYSYWEVVRKNRFLLNKNGVKEIKWRKC